MADIETPEISLERGATEDEALGFGIYLHIPFCLHKCSYCDFYSYTDYANNQLQQHTLQLKTEIRKAFSELQKRGWTQSQPSVTSIFFGGGTPSLIPLEQYGPVFETIESCFGLSSNVEITLETNPETVDTAYLEKLRHSPINRVSLGAQSFDPRFLSILERQCGPDQIRKAVQRIQDEAGLEEINLDLIFAIPGQTQKDILTDLDCAIALSPKHLSFYNLTLGKQHKLYPKLPTPEACAEFYEQGIEHLAQAGYQQYEISNFSLGPTKNHQSKHNLLYWNGGNYLGVGPTAASRFFIDGVFWHRKLPDPRWIASTKKQTWLEASFLELRKNTGVALPTFANRYGYDLATASNFDLFLSEGFIERESEWIRLTPKGRLLADRVTSGLVDV